MNAYTSRTFWGSFAVVFMALFLSMAITTFSYEFSYGTDLAAAEQGHYITACSPVADWDFSDPLTSTDHAVLTARSATLTANSHADDDYQQDIVVASALQLPASRAAFASDLPPSDGDITLSVNSCAILIE